MGDRVRQRWVIVYVDGFTFCHHQLVADLGVTIDGRKVPLAVVEGTTENDTLARRLLADLADRGLDGLQRAAVDRRRIQGAELGDSAVFGDHAIIGRCRLHKERNVLDHLEETLTS